MIPVLFDSVPVNATNMVGSAKYFSGNGIGILRDTVTASVVNTLKNEYELELEVSMSDPLFEKLRVGRIVVADAGEKVGRQAFVIEEITKTVDGIARLWCPHVSQHWGKLIPVMPFTAESAGMTEAMEGAAAAVSVSKNPFVFRNVSGYTSNIVYENKIPRSLRDLVAGSEGSLLDTYGGDFTFDNFDIIWQSRKGSTDGIRVYYGLNMEELEAEESYDWDATPTGCIGYWRDDDADVTVTGTVQYSTRWSSSQYKNIVSNYYNTVTVDFSDEFDEQPTVADINAKALEWVTNKGLVSTNIRVKPNALSVESFGLGDTVLVSDSELNIEYESRIIGYKFDVLAEEYISVEIGDPKTTINEAIAGTITGDIS